MAKLADITEEIRIILKILAVSLIAVTAVFLFFQGGSIVKSIFFPTPPAPPEQKFGKLPPADFPKNTTGNPSYTINTLTGNLPENFKDRVNVYKIVKDTPSLVALDAVREKLKSLGFDQNEAKVSDSVYQWNNANGDTIQYDIFTNNFKIYSNFLNEDPPTSVRGVASTKKGAYQTTQTFLDAIGENTTDLDPDKATISFLKIQNGQLVAADSQNDAQFVRLDLFQKDIDGKYKIYYPDLNSSPMYFIYRNEGDIPRIVDAGFTHFIPDTNASSTYPLKTPEQAYEDLKKGQGLLFNPTGAKHIDITDVQQGYYLGSNDQQYLLPIIIFEGKDFTGLVSAVKD
ncbi:MAG TPA: hypothetical protein VG917_03065 [Patescibacteria group bacterium]|nr:hypothetical protein [Patescibacteria group bacterium]